MANVTTQIQVQLSQLLNGIQHKKDLSILIIRKTQIQHKEDKKPNL